MVFAKPASSHCQNYVPPTNLVKYSYVLVKENKQKELNSIAPYAYDFLFKNYYKFLDLSS